MITVPKLNKFVSVIDARPRYCLGEERIALPHDEDAEDARNVMLHLFPLDESILFRNGTPRISLWCGAGVALVACCASLGKEKEASLSM